MKLKVGISARHIHLTEVAFKSLFGENAILTSRNNLSQTGQFACNETVTIKNDNYEISNVRILGPFRSYNQIEISASDALKFKINPPVRDSGDLKDAETLTVVGPESSLLLKESVIISCRHIHLNASFAKENGYYERQLVSISKDGVKGGIMKDVHIKTHDTFVNEIHLDTDDANAFLIKNGDEMEVINNA